MQNTYIVHVVKELELGTVVEHRGANRWHVAMASNLRVVVPAATCSHGIGRGTSGLR